jgi:hypothetical protein
MYSIFKNLEKIIKEFNIIKSFDFEAYKNIKKNNKDYVLQF